jgi:MinD superfamily P-loop ATPase
MSAQPIIITVASGKGGTGKTTIATSLAISLANDPKRGASCVSQILFLDCDVEAPNAHLFLEPTLNQSQEVGILIPTVNEARCTHCGECAQVCQYHAIAVLGEQTLIFPNICHGCGSCTLICPEEAISETLEVMGVVERGFTSDGIEFARGVLNIGEPMAVPVIRQLKRWVIPQSHPTVIIDAPPGVSCPVVEASRDADFLLLVTEPTPFGLHDLKLAVEMSRELQIPTGIILNRDGLTGEYNSAVEIYCQEQGIPILGRIPFERKIAEGIAQGKPLVDIHPEYIQKFQQIFYSILHRSTPEALV